MNKQLILFLFAFIIISSFVSAENYPQSSEVDLKFNYAKFNACAANPCNVTIVNPLSANIVTNLPTSENIGYSNFTLNSSQTSQTGTYQVFLIAANGTFYDDNFGITPNGEVATSASAIFYIGLLGLLVIFFGLLVYFGVTTDHIWVKATSWGFGYLFLIGISFIAWRMSADFLTSSPFLIDFLRITFYVLMIGFFPFILVLFVYGVYMMLTIKEITDMIDKGIPEGEARERAGWKK